MEIGRSLVLIGISVLVVVMMRIASDGTSTKQHKATFLSIFATSIIFGILTLVHTR